MNSWKSFQGPTKLNSPQLSKAVSFRRAQRIFQACFSILSLASVLVTLKPCSSSITESTLKNKWIDKYHTLLKHLKYNALQKHKFKSSIMIFIKSNIIFTFKWLHWVCCSQFLDYIILLSQPSQMENTQNLYKVICINQVATLVVATLYRWPYRYIAGLGLGP